MVEFQIRIEGKMNPLHDMSPQEEEKNSWKTAVVIAIERELQHAEAHLAAHHNKGDVDACTSHR